VILLENLTKRFGPKILFENVSMQFDPGKRYGLTGANGAGKSTLIKMLSGTEESDTGGISIPGGLRLGVLKQNHFEYDDQRILDAVMMGNKALWEALQEKETLLAGEITDEIGVRLGELEGTIAEENGYMAESEAAELLEGLGIPADKHGDKMDSLPAGYKLRVLIAQVLFGKPDVLLLDEPTNHLDLDSIRWLETFLTNEFKGTLVLISHDRHFLNAVATSIADVDYQTITEYSGGYTDFVEQKYENKQRDDQKNVATKKKIEELQGFVQRFGAHASKSSQAQSRVKQIEKLKEDMQSRGTKRTSLIRPFVRFEFEKPSGRDVLRVEKVTKSFQVEATKDAKGRKVGTGGTRRIFKDLNLNVNRGERIAVIGPNGIGKSTLLKLMVGAYANLDADTKKDILQPDSGEIRWGHDVSVGYFAQDHHEALGHASAGSNAFQWLYGFDKQATQEHIRGILGRLLFSGEAALKPVEALSGGECARLLVSKLLLLQHNVLVLDEPTNHLDIESIEGLLDGLKLFKGTIVVVSHDRHFVSELATRVIELQPAKDDEGTYTKIDDFNGTYEEFLERAGRDYLRK
jgi:ATPase subunit of ABC transporter with duplicated ATPase domains